MCSQAGNPSQLEATSRLAIARGRPILSDVKIVLLIVLLGQAEPEATIHLRQGGYITGTVVGVESDGVQLRGMSGRVYLIPLSYLPADWQLRCARGKHVSVNGLAGSMGQL